MVRLTDGAMNSCAQNPIPSGHLPFTDGAHHAPFIIPVLLAGAMQSPAVILRVLSLGFGAQKLQLWVVFPMLLLAPLT